MPLWLRLARFSIVPSGGACHACGLGNPCCFLCVCACVRAGQCGLLRHQQQNQAAPGCARDLSRQSPKAIFRASYAQSEDRPAADHLLQPLQYGPRTFQALRAASRVLPPSGQPQRDRRQLLRVAAHALVFERVGGAAQLHHLARRQQPDQGRLPRPRQRLLEQDREPVPRLGAPARLRVRAPARAAAGFALPPGRRLARGPARNI